jgi:hypothetical protein
MPTKSYNRILICFFAGTSCVVTFFVFWLEPYVGDLTRIGGYKENEYGWNQEQKKFITPHFILGDNIEDYDKYYDVVTIGDSFSVNEAKSWQNYLALSSDASIITFHRRSVNITKVLGHKQFRETPPKLLIFEIVEHGIQTALPDMSLSQEEEPLPLEQFLDFEFKKVDFSKHMKGYHRKKSSGLSMDTALHFIKTNLKQKAGSRIKAVPKVVKNKELLFSNKEQSSVLFYHLDNLKLSISKEEWSIIESRFATAQSLVQKNNHTTFLAMIAPDKRTSYGHLIQDESDKYSPAIELMPGNHQINWIDTLGGIKQMIDNRVVDVYLPNDIHWGSEGYRAAYLATRDKIRELSSKQR